jgi:hypothetical protein
MAGIGLNNGLRGAVNISAGGQIGVSHDHSQPFDDIGNLGPVPDGSFCDGANAHIGYFAGICRTHASHHRKGLAAAENE